MLEKNIIQRVFSSPSYKFTIMFTAFSLKATQKDSFKYKVFVEKSIIPQSFDKKQTNKVEDMENFRPFYSIPPSNKDGSR